MIDDSHIEYKYGTEVYIQGEVTLDHLVENHAKHFGRPDHQSLKFVIVNLLDCKKFDANEGMGIIHFSKRQPTYQKTHHLCYVVKDETIKSQIKQMIAMFGNPIWHYHFYDNLEEARRFCKSLS